MIRIIIIIIVIMIVIVLVGTTVHTHTYTQQQIVREESVRCLSVKHVDAAAGGGKINAPVVC